MANKNEKLIQRIEIDLQSKNDKAVSDAFSDVHYLLEKARLGKDLHIDPTGFSREVADAELSHDEILVLTKILQSFVEGFPASTHAGEAIWALAAIQNEAVKNFMIKSLPKFYELRANHAIYITLIALEDFGENVLPQKTSKGLLEVEDNLRYAKLYLVSKGLI